MLVRAKGVSMLILHIQLPMGYNPKKVRGLNLVELYTNVLPKNENFLKKGSQYLIT